jgi:hypothetical protein
MSAQIFVIQEGPIPEESGPRVLQEGYSLKIRPVVVDGITCLPIFSSLQRLQSALDREARYIALNAADLLQSFRAPRRASIRARFWKDPDSQ